MRPTLLLFLGLSCLGLSCPGVISPCFAADPEPVMTDKNYKPIIGAARFHHYVSQTYLNPSFYAAALGAAIGGQIRNQPPEWGQGVQGYATRSASNLGQFLTQATVHDGSAALFRLDPRYVRSGQQGFSRRFLHAIKWTFLTYDEERRLRPNFPIVLGAYGSGMIQTLWYPDRYNPLKDGVRIGTQQLGYSVGINVVKEFGPELRRLVRR